MKETWVWSLGWEDLLEEEVATHSRILTWKIPQTKEPGGLQSVGLQRVRHDWVTWEHAAAAAKSLQSCLTLCHPRDGSLPGSSVPGILQARTPEWVALSFSNAWEWKVKVKLLSCVWLRDPMDCSPPGSSIHGIFQARILEWGAIEMSSQTLLPDLR